VKRVSAADLRVLIPALAVAALTVLWAAHDGGYDADTWYWGALAMLALAGVVWVGNHSGWPFFGRPLSIAVLALAAYVAWSYLSILWADAPGQALDGSNRALMYLLLFATFAALPFGERSALTTQLAFVLGAGSLAVVEFLRLLTGHLIGPSFEDGRLVAPTGYFNATAALFTMIALMAVVLAARPTLPALLRGVLSALACGALQLALLGQSRGWLFTLPFVLVAALILVRDRLRVAMYAALVAAGALAAVPRLLDVFPAFHGVGTPIGPLAAAARRASHTGVVICAAVLLVATAIAVYERQLPLRLSPRSRRRIGTVLVLSTFFGAAGGAIAATHGDPFGFVSRQWNGFTHYPSARGRGSHFAAVGSGRYDFWRVAWHATASHPIGGLGQDNFGDFYVSRRRTYEEPSWTHSLELRLLTHTGFVGFALFTVFLVAAFRAAAPSLRRPAPAAGVAAIALLPMVDWLIHGSVDWFWEFPALTAPALAFLGMACALRPAVSGAGPPRRRVPRGVPTAAGVIALIAGAIVLGFPYLSVREISSASDVRARNPAAALSELADAANLNPLNAEPGRLGGTIALQTGRPIEAEHRFRQAITREPHGWFAWFGDGLAASVLGDAARADRDFRIAARIDSREPAISDALGRVNTTHPMTPAEALRELVLAQ
jgi:hypothetical protein